MKKIIKWDGLIFMAIRNMPPENRRKLAKALDGLEEILAEIRGDYDI